MTLTRPLLVIDGDSFAHRAYHAVPKTIRRAGNKGAGAIVGFANFLLKLYESEQPRAVLVGWDTLDAPTYRHKALEGYQAGRRFDDELLEQLNVLPDFVAACGFASAKAPGYEADDFLAAAATQEEQEGGTVIVATGDRDAYQFVSEATTILQPVRAGEMARIGPAEVRERYGVDPDQVPDFIALRGERQTEFRAQRGSARREPRASLENMDRSKMRSRQDAFRPRPGSCAFIARLRPWIDRRRCQRCRIRDPHGVRRRPSPGIGTSISSRKDLKAWRNADLLRRFEDSAMRPLLHPCLLNGRKGDPALYIETLFEKHAVLFDLGDLSNLPPRKIQRFENAIGLGAFAASWPQPGP